jgi:hypothetical protein
LGLIAAERSNRLAAAQPQIRHSPRPGDVTLPATRFRLNLFAAAPIQWQVMRVNKSSKGKSPASGNPPPPPADLPPAAPAAPEADLEQLSTLQLVDLLTHRLVMQGAMPPDMPVLRQRVAEMEEMQDQARVAIEKLSEAVDKLRAPALRLGTLLQKLPKQRALVCVNSTEYICSLDPSIPEVALETGARVLLNEAFAVTDTFGFDRNGPVVKVTCRQRVGHLRPGGGSLLAAHQGKDQGRS